MRKWLKSNFFLCKFIYFHLLIFNWETKNRNNRKQPIYFTFLASGGAFCNFCEVEFFHKKKRRYKKNKQRKPKESNLTESVIYSVFCHSENIKKCNNLTSLCYCWRTPPAVATFHASPVIRESYGAHRPAAGYFLSSFLGDFVEITEDESSKDYWDEPESKEPDHQLPICMRKAVRYQH